MKKILALTVITLSVLTTLSTTAFALEAPRAGTDKATVEKQLGAPQAKSSVVGQPPISSWEYPQFTVYFESEHVIHAVAKTSTKKQTK